MRLGHGPRRTVVILWAWTALLSGFVLVPLYFPRGNLFIPLGLAVLVLSLYTWFHPGLRKRDPVLDENNPWPWPVPQDPDPEPDQAPGRERTARELKRSVRRRFRAGATAEVASPASTEGC